MSTTAYERYMDSQLDRGLVRVMVMIPDTPESRKKIQASAKRIRKQAGKPLPRD